MNEHEESGFSWITCFLVTGISFLMFSTAIRLLSGEHNIYFLYIGLVCTGAGLISWLGKKVYQ